MILSAFHAILIAGIVGTTLMTLFSQLVSKIRNLEFNEAQLLNILIDRTKFLPEINSENAIWGWLVHYIIGIIVAAWMYFIFQHFNLAASIFLGGILGLAAGIIGAIGWVGLFAFHPRPPETDIKEFVVQLLMAHCVFGCTVAIIFRIFT